MNRWLGWVVAAAALQVLSGCGPSVSDSGAGDSNGDTGSVDTDASASGGGTQTTGSGSTSATDTTGTTNGPVDTGIPSGVGSDSTNPGSSTSFSSSAGSSTTAGACIEDDGYRAALLIGGIDRIRIFRRDDEVGSCTWLTVAAIPKGESAHDVDSTAPWVVESAAWNNAPESCDDDYPGKMGENSIPDIWGTIDLSQASPQQPCFIDLDVQLQLLENPDPPVIGRLCQSMVSVGSCLFG